HRNRRRLLNPQQQRIVDATAELSRETLTHECLAILRRRHTCYTIELPKPFINTVNLHPACPTLTRLVNNNTVNGDQRTSHSKIGSKLLAEEVRRGNQIVGIA